MKFTIKKNNRSPANTSDLSNIKIKENLNENIEKIKKALSYTDDFEERDITYKNKTGKLIYLDTMADSQAIENTFLLPLLEANENEQINTIIANANINHVTTINDIISGLIKGDAALLLEEDYEAYLFTVPQNNSRSPEEPENERVIRGSHQGFTENLNTNLNLVRRRISNQQLVFHYIKLGLESNTKVVIMYLNNLANPALVEEAKRRLNSMSLDAIFSPGYIEECIEEHPLSPFPQNIYTERPDRVEAHLMEGRVAIMTSNSSDTIIMPVTFFSFFQTVDDFHNRPYIGSLFRLLRLIGFWGTLILPSLYIAVISFHYEIIPFEMVPLVKQSIEFIPYPPFIEAVIMVFTIELIREAGIRLPSPVGETIGIVGGLIIGESVVNAGFISNIMIVVIALTAIMSFTIPSYEMGNTVRILSLPVMIMASILGFVGIVISLVFIIIHMCKIESFGTPYLAPIAPLYVRDLKDTLVRLPIWKLNKRPDAVKPKKKFRPLISRGWDSDD